MRDSIGELNYKGPNSWVEINKEPNLQLTLLNK